MRRVPAALTGTVLLILAGCGHAPAHPVADPSTPGATPGAALSARPSPSAAPTPARPAACPILPADNIWHTDISTLPVSTHSRAWVASIGAGAHAHPDFGSGLIDGAPFGLPVTTVPAGTKGVRVSFQYAGESDRGPYPIPSGVRVEGGANADGDRHVILLDLAGCKAYELYAAHRTGSGWQAGSGAVYNLRSDALRPAGWTSADAAGLPILPGLVRYEEVAAGHIDHAIRFTAPDTRNGYVWPARHAASDSTNAALPPMGARFRLKSTVDISHFSRAAKVIAQAMMRYGLILADNGSPWYFSGTEDNRWNNDALNDLKSLTGNDFEAVDTGGLMVSPNSGQAR